MRVLSVGVALFPLLLLLVQPASASHFRYWTMSWNFSNSNPDGCTNNPTNCEINMFLTTSWRASAYYGADPRVPSPNNYPNAPGTGYGIGKLDWGDSSTDLDMNNGDRNSANPLLGNPISWSSEDDWVTWQLPPVPHTYNLNNIGTSVTLSYDLCCRIGGLKNSGSMARTRTVIAKSALLAGLPGPASLQEPILVVNQGSGRRFQYRATDSLQRGRLKPVKDLRFSFSTNSGLNSGQNPPGGMQWANPVQGSNGGLSNDGIISWSPQTLGDYALQVKVEDDDGCSTTVDSIIRVKEPPKKKFVCAASQGCGVGKKADPCEGPGDPACGCACLDEPPLWLRVREGIAAPFTDSEFSSPCDAQSGGGTDWEARWAELRSGPWLYDVIEIEYVSNENPMTFNTPTLQVSSTISPVTSIVTWEQAFIVAACARPGSSADPHKETRAHARPLPTQRGRCELPVKAESGINYFGTRYKLRCTPLAETVEIVQISASAVVVIDGATGTLAQQTGFEVNAQNQPPLVALLSFCMGVLISLGYGSRPKPTLNYANV